MTRFECEGVSLSVKEISVFISKVVVQLLHPLTNCHLTPELLSHSSCMETVRGEKRNSGTGQSHRSILAANLLLPDDQRGDGGIEKSSPPPFLKICSPSYLCVGELVW